MPCWFQVRYTEHGSFSTWYWSVTSTSLPNPRETARTITDWTLWFLNKYLKGSADSDAADGNLSADLQLQAEIAAGAGRLLPPPLALEQYRCQ